MVLVVFCEQYSTSIWYHYLHTSNFFQYMFISLPENEVTYSSIGPGAVIHDVSCVSVLKIYCTSHYNKMILSYMYRIRRLFVNNIILPFGIIISLLQPSFDVRKLSICYKYRTDFFQSCQTHSFPIIFTAVYIFRSIWYKFSRFVPVFPLVVT